MTSCMNVNKKTLDNMSDLNCIREKVVKGFKADSAKIKQIFSDIIKDDQFIKVDKVNEYSIKINCTKKLICKLEKDSKEISEYMQSYVSKLFTYLINTTESIDEDDLDYICKSKTELRITDKEFSDKYVYYVFDIVHCTIENYFIIKINTRQKKPQ